MSVIKSKIKKQKGGDGYYQAVSEPPIGGRPARATYPSCCPPVFCSNLTGGSKKNKSISMEHRIGHGIYEIEKFLDNLKKHELNQLLNSFIVKKKNKHLHDYNKHFNKNTLRTMASALILDSHINGVINKVNKHNTSSSIKLNIDSTKLNSLFSYLYNIKNGGKLKNNHNHSGGMMSADFVSLSYYIGPIGIGVFSASAILYLLQELYNYDDKKNNTIKKGGGKVKKKDIIDYIEKLINPIHLYKFTKKSISDLGKFGDNFKKSFHKNKKIIKKKYKSTGGYRLLEIFDEVF